MTKLKPLGQETYRLFLYKTELADCLKAISFRVADNLSKWYLHLNITATGQMSLTAHHRTNRKGLSRQKRRRLKRQKIWYIFLACLPITCFKSHFNSVWHLHVLLVALDARTIRPFGVANNPRATVWELVGKRGKEEQVGHRQSRAHNPDAQRDAQRRSASHSRPQWVHNCHVPEIGAVHFERHVFLKAILYL